VTCPRDAAGLWHVCVLSWICEKNHIKKNCYHPQYFKGKNYKTIFPTSSILKKNKIDNYEKKQKKMKKKKMTILEEKKSKKQIIKK
jgi:hypothetical protein